MNCPHGAWSPDQIECSSCVHERELEAIAQHIELVRDLARCDHVRHARAYKLAGGRGYVQLCGDCGAMRFDMKLEGGDIRRGMTSWEPIGFGRRAKALDLEAEARGATVPRSPVDSGAKNIIPIKPRT